MMKITKLTIYWDAGDAYAVIEFLDALRDILWSAYGDDITAMLKEAKTQSSADNAPIEWGDDSGSVF